VSNWKESFLGKLHEAQSECAKQFEDTLDRVVAPVFEEMSSFLGDNGFKISTPLSESGRRSFKFELAENAYLLMIFRFSGIAEFELRDEVFAPGTEPMLEKSVGRLADIDKEWATSQFQAGLDHFVDLLVGRKAEEPSAELVEV